MYDETGTKILFCNDNYLRRLTPVNSQIPLFPCTHMHREGQIMRDTRKKKSDIQVRHQEQSWEEVDFHFCQRYLSSCTSGTNKSNYHNFQSYEESVFVVLPVEFINIDQ